MKLVRENITEELLKKTKMKNPNQWKNFLKL